MHSDVEDVLRYAIVGTRALDDLLPLLQDTLESETPDAVLVARAVCAFHLVGTGLLASDIHRRIGAEAAQVSLVLSAALMIGTPEGHRMVAQQVAAFRTGRSWRVLHNLLQAAAIPITAPPAPPATLRRAGRR